MVVLLRVLTFFRSYVVLRALVLSSLVLPQILILRSILNSVLNMLVSLIDFSLFSFVVQIWNFLGMTENVMIIIFAYLVVWWNRIFMRVVQV